MLTVRQAWIGLVSLLVLFSLVTGGCGTADPRASGEMISGVASAGSLVGAPVRESANPGMSPEEIGQHALEQLRSGHGLIQVLSGTPEVILARQVTPDERAAFTGNTVCSLSANARLVLVVFKGDFELAAPAPVASRSSDSYAVKVFDQERGQDLGGVGGFSTDEAYQTALARLNAASSAAPGSTSTCEEHRFPEAPIPDRPGAG